MSDDDDKYFVESVGAQLRLMFWTSLATLIIVGTMLWIAL